ncbi:MAG TPA: hypothetical protein VGG61_04525 [Gemmataceae bacterium]
MEVERKRRGELDQSNDRPAAVFKNSLREWQARYKQSQATKTTVPPKSGGCPAVS